VVDDGCDPLEEGLLVDLTDGQRKTDADEDCCVARAGIQQLPAFVQPMAVQVVQRLPEGDEWMYEVKFDGYRALLVKNDNSLQIRSRNNKDLTRTYPGICSAGLHLRAHMAVVDGEIVAVDANGHPSFQALQHRAAHPGHTILFYAFDLLHLDGKTLTGPPLQDRRSALTSVVKDSGILLSEPLRGTADRVTEAVRAIGLEGVIAKRKNSRYDAGQRYGAWVKLKLDRQQEFVVGGYRPGPHGVDALLVGFYEGTGLRFAGKVRAGFTPHVGREVFAQVKPLACRSLPIRGSSKHYSRALGRGRDRRTDDGDAVAQAQAGRADSVRRMDRRQSAASRGVSRPAN
jgi:DNA ligase D-like protein (predicted ligase)